MKKLLAILGVVVLTGCSNPEVIRPYVGGPTYYKEHQCVVYNYPKYVYRWNSELGMNERYVATNTYGSEVCNYNKLYAQKVSLYGRYQ